MVWNGFGFSFKEGQFLWIVQVYPSICSLFNILVNYTRNIHTYTYIAIVMSLNKNLY